MAATASNQHKSDTNVSNKSDYDPELDFCSDKFDPLKALNTPGLKPPVQNAGAYDNLSKYETASTGKRTHAPKVKENAAPSTEFKRNFLPHQSKLFLHCYYIILLRY